MLSESRELGFTDFLAQAEVEIAEGFRDQGGLTPGTRVWTLLHSLKPQLAIWAKDAGVDCSGNEGKDDRIANFLKWVEEHWDEPSPRIAKEREEAANHLAPSGSQRRPAE